MNNPAENFTGFAEYLSQQRQRLALSQEELAAELTARSSVFAGVDAATISRWERAKVQPTLRRKVELVLFFGDDPYQLREQLDLTLDGGDKLQAFTNILDSELSYNHYIGAHPYLLKRTHYFDKVFTPPKTNTTWPQRVANFQQNVTRGKERWSVSRVAALQSHPAANTVYYLVDGELAGHLIMLRLKQHCFDDILADRIVDSDIDVSMLAADSEPYSFYTLSGFGGSRDIAVDVLAEQLAILIRDKNFAYLGFKARNDFGSKIVSFFTSELIHKGPKTSEKNFGIKIGSARYEYASYRISREAIYVSKLSFYLMGQQ